MKTLIIENEYTQPEELTKVLSLFPERFGEVNLQIGCRHRPVEDIGMQIAKADNILIKSTFLYKYQLEEFVEAFIQKAFGNKPFEFYIYNFVNTLNEWNEEQFIHFDEPSFKSNIIQLITEYKVYDFWYEYEIRQITYNKQTDKFEI